MLSCMLGFVARRTVETAVLCAMCAALIHPAAATSQSGPSFEEAHGERTAPTPVPQIDRRLPTTRQYVRELERSRFHELYNEFGRHKELPEKYALQILLALSHFPELKDTRIRFRVRRAVVPLMALPRFFTLFRRREHRAYTIVISSGGIEALAPLLVRNLSFNAQIGIIGHEIAHVADYERRGFGPMARFGLCYLSGRCRTTIERSTDRSTIEKGLGWQLYAHRRDLAASDFGDEQDEPHAYLSTCELLAHMGKTGDYPELHLLVEGFPSADR